MRIVSHRRKSQPNFRFRFFPSAKFDNGASSSASHVASSSTASPNERLYANPARVSTQFDRRAAFSPRTSALLRSPSVHHFVSLQMVLSHPVAASRSSRGLVARFGPEFPSRFSENRGKCGCWSGAGEDQGLEGSWIRGERQGGRKFVVERSRGVSGLYALALRVSHVAHLQYP